MRAFSQHFFTCALKLAQYYTWVFQSALELTLCTAAPPYCKQIAQPETKLFCVSLRVFLFVCFLSQGYYTSSIVDWIAGLEQIYIFFIWKMGKINVLLLPCLQVNCPTYGSLRNCPCINDILHKKPLMDNELN